MEGQNCRRYTLGTSREARRQGAFWGAFADEYDRTPVGPCRGLAEPPADGAEFAWSYGGQVASLDPTLSCRRQFDLDSKTRLKKEAKPGSLETAVTALGPSASSLVKAYTATYAGTWWDDFRYERRAWLVDVDLG